MRSYKCDRCGEEYQVMKYSPKFVLKKRIKKENGGIGYDYIDVCKSCYLSFVRWFYKGDVENFKTEYEDYCGKPIDTFLDDTDGFPPVEKCEYPDGFLDDTLHDEISLGDFPPDDHSLF